MCFLNLFVTCHVRRHAGVCMQLETVTQRPAHNTKAEKTKSKAIQSRRRETKALTSAK